MREISEILIESLTLWSSKRSLCEANMLSNHGAGQNVG